MPGYKVDIPGGCMTPSRRKRITCAVCGFLVRDALRNVTSQNSYCRSCLSDQDVGLEKDSEVDREVERYMIFIQNVQDLQIEKQMLMRINEDTRKEMSEMKKNLYLKKDLKTQTENYSVHRHFSTLAGCSSNDQDVLRDEILPVKETSVPDGQVTKTPAQPRLTEEDKEKYEESSDTAHFNDMKKRVLSLTEAENTTSADLKELRLETVHQQNQFNDLKRLDAVLQQPDYEAHSAHQHLTTEPEQQTPTLSKSFLVTGHIPPKLSS